MITIDKCHFCGSDKFSFITNKGDKFSGERVNLCNGCGLIFLSPRMGTEELKDYYEEDGFSRDFRGGAAVPDASKIKENKRRAQIRWDSVKSIADEHQTLFEIGCSSGEFLELAQDGFSFVSGIDASTGYVEYAKSRGLDVTCGEFPDDDSNSIYDVICMFHTLEHMENPLQVLIDIYQRLDANGLLILEYPDVELATRRNTFSPKYFQKSHLYDFSFNNLLMALDHCGFAVRKSLSGWPYPQDKNVLLICEKSSIGGGTPFDSSFASELYARIINKIGIIEVISQIPHIAHFASHHINVGDGAIITSIQDRLGSLTDGPLHFSNIDIVDYFSGDSQLTAKWLKENDFDLVLVGGGGTIDSHENRELSGTAFSMSLDEMSKVDIPMAFIGLGENTFYNQKVYHSDKIAGLIALCKERGWPFSVRADKSKERLARRVSDVSYVDVIPDPGFFIITNKAYTPMGLFNKPRNILLQMSPDAYEHRFGGRNQLIAFVELMGRYFYYFANTHGCHFSLACHTIDDIAMYNILQQRLAGTDAYHFARTSIDIVGTAHPTNAPLFFRSYEEADLVIGMRGHSIICATGLGIPVIAIDTHPKVRGYMEEIGLEEWCLRPDELGDGGKLVEMTIELLGNPSRQLDIVKESTRDWRNQFDSFLLKILGLIS